MTHLLIVGGSDAGISAALRARELDSRIAITIALSDRFPNYSICGLPFFLSGEVPDWHDLAHRTADDITCKGIRLLMNHTAHAINPVEKTVSLVNEDGQPQSLNYDKLVIGTGATPIRPKIAGLDLPGVFLLRSMTDSFAIHQFLTESQPKSVLIIGGGYIGLEMADALTLRGIVVTVVDHNPTVLKTVDTSLGQQVKAELNQHGVEVVTEISVESIETRDDRLQVSGSPDFTALADMVLVSTGVRPSAELAETAGIATGTRGAIRVSRKMETHIPDIYAAGDCAETWHQLLNQYSYMPLGTTAHKQGRIAGENAVGGDREFAGSLGTQVVKIFDLAVARTGLRDEEAIEAGFDPITVEMETWDHKAYYPGAHRVRIRMTGDRQTGQLLGAQLAGHYQGEVAKRIDIVAAALFQRLSVETLNDLDLSYTPPLSSPWDPVQMAAQAWCQQVVSNLQTVSSH